MARLQLIIPLLLWGIWSDSTRSFQTGRVASLDGTLAYVATVVGIVIGMALLARSTMRRATVDRAAAVPRFHRAAFSARWLVLGLHVAALWWMGYGDAVRMLSGNIGTRFPSVPAFLSLAPVVFAWVGLMAAQYPLDRAVREQNAVYAFEFGEPVRPVPTYSAYVLHGLRSQVLFTLAPLAALAVLRDGLLWALNTFTRLSDGTVLWVSTLGAATAVFILAPELLRRVLPTTSLPASPVRDRLIELSRTLRLGVRDVLLWHTHHGVGNAAVMGVVPGVRYIMMTDLLLDSMPPEQVEAVFAHEAGHVVHRHIAWYIAFWVGTVLWLGLIGEMITRARLIDVSTAEWLLPIGGLVGVVALFGWLSRGFERQADAFAAKWVGRSRGEAAPLDGSAIFADALRTVGRMNNLPLDVQSLTAGRPLIGRLIGRAAHHAATWLHGGIRSRITHVAELTHDQNAFRRFGVKMLAVRCGIAVLLASGIVATVLIS